MQMFKRKIRNVFFHYCFVFFVLSRIHVTRVNAVSGGGGGSGDGGETRELRKDLGAKT